ncbi:MAG TPA: phytanoyl-CoA dioxygenase family protein [Acidobacteriaceae bacterium]|jgi:ectoine hydroxylase-related dioxygenase (phytanoyl-CoA dioxygenase family)
MIDLHRFDRDGFAIAKSLLSPDEVDRLLVLLSPVGSDSDTNRGGVRDVLDRVPKLRGVAEHHAVRRLVDTILGSEALLVRATMFDKTADSNWKVPWHQDLTIAVDKRLDTPSYGPWSVKSGLIHVQAPTSILMRMLTVRIHLDPCPAENGALRVMPGSHKLGRIDQNYAVQYVDERAAVYCEAMVGDALLMRPLLLHASSVCQHPFHRRVLHLDFAAGKLDGELQWRMRS